MMLRTLVVIFGMSINAAAQVAPRAHSLSAAEVEAVKQGVRGGLLNPAAARFSTMRAVRVNEGVVRVCGYVNTTNSRNIYIGKRVFAGTLTVSPASAHAVFAELNHVDLSSAAATCRQYGVPGF